MRAARLIKMVLLLQSRPSMTAAELARELEVSERTVARDAQALSEAGVPVYADRGRAGGYRLIGGYRTRLTGLARSEAEALFLSGVPGALREMGLEDAASAARLKVSAALLPSLRDAPRTASQRFHLDAPAWFREPQTPTLLPTIAEAVWDDRCLTTHYRRGEREVERTLEPYGLVLKAGVWYLCARVLPSGDGAGDQAKVPDAKTRARSETGARRATGMRGAGGASGLGDARGAGKARGTGDADRFGGAGEADGPRNASSPDGLGDTACLGEASGTSNVDSRRDGDGTGHAGSPGDADCLGEVDRLRDTGDTGSLDEAGGAGGTSNAVGSGRADRLGDADGPRNAISPGSLGNPAGPSGTNGPRDAGSPRDAQGLDGSGVTRDVGGIRGGGASGVRGTLDAGGSVGRAGARGSGGFRTYRIDLVTSVADHGTRFVRDEAFDLPGFWAAQAEGFARSILRDEVVVRLSAQGVRRLAYVIDPVSAREALRGAGEADGEGWVTATLPVESEEVAHGQLMALGPEVEVLAPAGLRERFARDTARLAELYGR